MELLRDLAISPQLEALLRKAKDVKQVHTPRQNVKLVDFEQIPEYDESDLPNNINSYPFSKYVRENFTDPSRWGVLSNVLRSALTRTIASKDEKVAIAMNRMILRFMIDKNLTGAECKLFCDYLIARLLMNYHMRDEALCQIASQTWKNYDEEKRKKMWILLSNCLSCIIPSPHLHNYLFKYVSDHGTDGYNSVLQQKLLRMPRNQSQEEGRLYPPSVLEWQTNHVIAPMAVMIHLPNNATVMVEANSWSTAEDVANRAIESITEGTAQGWSLMLVRDKVMTEISGHDYLFDLISKMEVFPGLETPHDGFISYGPGLQRPSNYNQSELLDPRPPTNNHREVPVDVPHDPLPDDANSQTGIDSNFSFGPPNIRLSNNAQRRPDQHIDPETGGMARRIKGGGKMMNGMGMPMQPQMMMQQPQMMPMQGMMQQPMMQQPMMQQPMMQQPMMQQPMMQQPMMQQPMMQQPMMQQPMMQQPMMQQPIMQPQMSMPNQQMPMRMPGSIGMIANSMDTPAEQAVMLRQMKSWIKQQEEKQKKSEENRRQQKSRNYRDYDDDHLRSRRHTKHRDDSSDEDRRTSHRHRDRRDSSEDDRRRSDRRRSRRDSGSYDRRKQHSGSYDRKKQDSGTIETKKQDHRKTGKIIIPKPRNDTPRKISVTDTDESEDITDIGTENGQGTVRMSFKQKRNFFEQRDVVLKTEPPPRKGHPKVIPLPKSEERPAPRKEKKPDDTEPEPREILKTPPPPVKKDPEQEAEDTHLEALKLIGAAKRKSKKDAKTKNMDAALLAMQRREAAARQKNATETKSPVKEDPPYMPPSSAKLQPRRMTPVKPKPILIPQLDESDSSPEESPKERSREDAISALEIALLARKRSERRKDDPLETLQDQAPPLPPPIQEEAPPPPLPPPIQEDIQPRVLTELPSDQNTLTVLHPISKTAPKTYSNVNWKLHVRKEIFLARDHIKNDEMYQFLFRQVAREAMCGNPRIMLVDQDHVKEHVQSSQKKDVPTSTKKTFVKNAMEKWPAYFTRIFSIKVTDTDDGLPNTLYQANSIGVGMTGVHFIVIHASSEWKLQSYQFSSISQVKEHGTIIVFQIDNKRVVISCRKSIELGRTMRPYMIDPVPMPPLGSPRNTQQAPEESEERGYQDFEPEKQEDIYEVVIPPEESNLSLLQYGEHYFAKKKDVTKALLFSKGTLSKPLHEISDQALVADSLKCYRAIQQFMGDAQAKSPPDLQIREIIGICNMHRRIVIDEVTIYLAKQTTKNNKSESLIKGWRLFAVFLAFFKCSDLLLPYLQAHLHNISCNGDETSSAGARVCQINLQKTMDYGGRRHMLSKIEIRTLLKGHVTSEQSFYSPGAGDIKFQMNTSSVIEDAIKYFCDLLGIKSEVAIKEYGVFMIVMNMNDEMVDVLPQVRRTYLLDIMSMAEKHNHKIMLLFQRVVWKQQINYDNENLVFALFHQAIGDYADGKSLTYEELTENPTRAQIAEYSKMSGLIHRGLGESSLPSIEQVKFYIPQKVAAVQSDFVWKESVHNDFMSIQQMSPAAARSEVLALLSNKRMFGANIFTVEVDSGNNQMTQKKMIAITPTKLYLMDFDNHRMEREIMLSDIEDVSSQGPEPGRMSAVDINIIGSSPLRLNSQKAAVITGVLNHHIHI